MNALYNLGIRFFILGARIAGHFNEKTKKFVNGRKGLWDTLIEHYHPTGKVAWFHCASVGEFEQARPIIEMVRKEKQEWQILVTFFSPSGYEMRKNWEGADWIFYLPFDTPADTSRFLDTVNPTVAVFIKYEFWLNMLEGLKKRCIPTYSVCSIFRREQVFFKWYGGMMRRTLRCFDKLLVQNEESIKLLAGIGVTNVEICGDTRFDRVRQICADKSGTNDTVAAFSSGSEVWIAGSSWGGDEEIIAEAISSAADNHKLILVPHEIDKPHISRIMELFAAFKPLLYSECVKLPAAEMEAKVKDARLLVVDAMGILSVIYRYARFAYIGGGFNKSGIHNILEAAIYGMPVIIGPHYHKFREAVELVRRGGAISVSDASDLSGILRGWTSDTDSRNRAAEICTGFINENLGATDRIFKSIFG